MASGPSPRPLSPWAQRFGVSHSRHDQIFKRSLIEHSRYAPSRPALDPKFYADRPVPFGEGRFLRGEEIDMFFQTEFGFKNMTMGMNPWQLGPLNRTLQFSTAGSVPGGHNAVTREQQVAHDTISRLEGLKVDEDSWLPFFRKDRWFSTTAHDSVLTSVLWSVDDPVVWEELRIVLELANRILTALIKDKHEFLETMLFGQLAYWENVSMYVPPAPEPYPNAPVLLSYKFMKDFFTKHHPHLPCPIDDIPTFGEELWRERLEKFTATQEWGLAPLDSPLGRAAGITFSSYNDFIIINPVGIRSVLQGDLTLAECCAARVYTAVTILHELMHALRHNRVRIDVEPRYNTIHPSADQQRHEPFVDYGGSAEVGYAFETAVFGGPFRDVIIQSLNYIPLGTVQVTWPFLPKRKIASLGINVDQHPDFSPTRENVTSAVPALFFSRLLSEEFWQDATIPRKSDGFFHRSDFFCFAKITKGAPPFTIPVEIAPIVRQNREQLALQTARGTMPKVVSDMLTDWEQSKTLWDGARASWYAPTKLMWSQSAWCNVGARYELTEFGDEIKKLAHQRDMFLLVHNALRLISTVPQSLSQNEYLDNLKNSECHWVWHAIGFLMLASIPLRSAVDSREPVLNMELRHFIPSHSVPPSRKSPKEIRWSGGGAAWAPTSCPPTQHIDPFWRPGQVIDTADVTHFDYLNIVRNMIEFWTMEKKPLSTPWLEEIIRVEGAIREARTNQWNNHGFVGSTWAADVWDFNIPEYDPLNMSTWNETTGSWVRV